MKTKNMSDKTTLGDRMKNNYEIRTKQFLTRRTPTVIRLDGKTFKTYTRGLNKPFDEGLIEDMQLTTQFLCQNVQGCKLGYTQSDEITLVLTDYDKLTSDAWFDYNVQKMTSVAASMATAKFNQLRQNRLFSGVDELQECDVQTRIGDATLAFFDARVFQIPEKEEVINCLIWRQRDAERNSIQMLAQSLFSHNELHKKNTSELQEMCFQKGHNWNDLDVSKKRGSLILKNTYVNGNIFPPTDNSMFFEDEKYYQIEKSPLSGRISHMEIKSPIIRTKWEVVETPIFSQDSQILKELL